jgi:hypothetical protein
MSHFSKIKTQFVEKEFLLKALKDLGYEYEEGEQTINGFGGNKAKVDILIRLRLSYDIGFRKNGDSYEIIADWWGVHGVKQKEFTEKLLQRYAYHATCAKLEAQGFSIVNEETSEKGKIHMVLRRLA